MIVKHHPKCLDYCGNPLIAPYELAGGICHKCLHETLSNPKVEDILAFLLAHADTMTDEEFHDCDVYLDLPNDGPNSHRDEEKNHGFQ